MTKVGHEKNGRSAYKEQFCKEENDLARRKRRVELRIVNQVFIRIIYQCNNALFSEEPFS